MPTRGPTLVAMLAILMLGISFVIQGEPKDGPASFRGTLRELLPTEAEVAEWTKTVRPVADTPEQQKRVARTLQFDAAEFVDYKNGERRLSVYIAHWQPGRVPHRAVAAHTPDVCWVGAGWSKRQQGTAMVRFPGTALPPLPLEHRSFGQKDRVEHVVFCHLVDGVAVSYGTGREPPWHAMFTDLFKTGLRQRGVQFFVRISSDCPWEEFREWAPVKVFFANLARSVPLRPTQVNLPGDPPP